MTADVFESFGDADRIDSKLPKGENTKLCGENCVRRDLS